MSREIRRVIIMLVAMLIGLLSPCWLFAADKSAGSENPKTTKSIFETIRDDQLSGKHEAVILVPPASPAGEDTETVQHHRRAWLAYYTYLTEGLEHRKKVFRWQYTSSLIIFFTVLLLVFIGIIFSGIQFYRAMRSPAHLSGKDGETMQSEIEAGPGGIKVSSPVLGVVILTVSLAFFYLYLVYVYPIKEIF